MALMTSSNTTVSSELEKVEQLLIENGYPDDVHLSCIKQILANFAAETRVVLKSFQFTINFPVLVMFHENLKTELTKPIYLVSML